MENSSALYTNDTVQQSIKPINDIEFLKILLALLGMVGNALAAIVWADDRRKSSSSLFLLNLSLYDLVYLGGVVISLILYFERFTSLNIPVLNVKIANNVLSIFYNSALCGSSLSTVAITAERYIAVTKPLKVIVICARKRARRVVMAIAGICAIYAVLYGMYVFMIVIPILESTPGVNLTRCLNSNGVPLDTNATVDICSQGNYVQWIVKYEYDLTVIVGQAVLVYVVPWITILILNTLLLRKMTTVDFGANFRSAARRQLEKRLVLSVMAVCALSLISHPVGFASMMLPLFVQGRPSAAGAFLFDAWNVLKLLNSGANFVFYSTISTQFRRTLVQKMKCPCQQRPKKKTYSYGGTSNYYEHTIMCNS